MGLGADVAAFRNLRRRLALDDGLSIIGVAIASFLILIALAPAASLFTATTVASVSGQARVFASNIATQVVEADRSLASNDFSSFIYNYWYLPKTNSNAPLLPTVICSKGGGTSASPCIVNSNGLGAPFTVTQIASWSSSSSSTPSTLDLSVTVTWTVGGNQGSVAVQSAVADPSWITANPQKLYQFSTSENPRSWLPSTTTGCDSSTLHVFSSASVSAYAILVFQNSDSATWAYLGQVPGSELTGSPSSVSFLMNNDAYYAGTQVDSIGGVAFVSGSTTVNCYLNNGTSVPGS